MSLTSQLPLAITQCASFGTDTFFEKARTALQEAGKLNQWISLNNDPHRTFEQIVNESTMDNVVFLPDRFEILVDARGFRPQEIQCSLSPTSVEIMAQKQEKINNTTRSLTLNRNYQLPQNVKPEDGICCLSSEGILFISAPWLK